MPQKYNPPGRPPKSEKHVLEQYLGNIELKTLSIRLIIVISYIQGKKGDFVVPTSRRCSP